MMHGHPGSGNTLGRIARYASMVGKRATSTGVGFLCAAGMSVTAVAQPQRIVSLSGDITEIVFACGAGDRLAGVDSTSLYPPEATTLAQVGYVATP